MIRGALVFLLAALAVSPAQQQQKQDVPDAPTPQTSAPLSDLKNQIAPGKGESSSATTQQESGQPQQQEQPQQPTTPTPDVQKNEPEEHPDMPEAGKGPEYVLHVPVNFVMVPVTVKDPKHNIVGGLTVRDFRIYENNVRQPIQYFTVDPFPLSIVFVVDQSISADTMQKVNESLNAVSGSLAPYDEAALITYNNGPRVATEFTGAQSARLISAIQSSKRSGRDMGVPVNAGPLASGPTINGHPVDPNLSPQRGNSSGFILIPKEVHTLNDAIFAAAKMLSNRSKDRRRVIYVISDGKEQGSKISQKEVIHYLQQYQIAVYATLVGDAARWGEGYLDKIHIPLQASNVLPKYVLATGGSMDAEGSVNGIERSYARLAEEARRRYTLGYYTHQPLIDGKYRSIDVRVLRPSLEVIAKPGYYPSAQDMR